MTSALRMASSPRSETSFSSHRPSPTKVSIRSRHRVRPLEAHLKGSAEAQHDVAAHAFAGGAAVLRRQRVVDRDDDVRASVRHVYAADSGAEGAAAEVVAF